MCLDNDKPPIALKNIMKLSGTTSRPSQMARDELSERHFNDNKAALSQFLLRIEKTILRSNRICEVKVCIYFISLDIRYK